MIISLLHQVLGELDSDQQSKHPIIILEYSLLINHDLNGPLTIISDPNTLQVLQRRLPKTLLKQHTHIGHYRYLIKIGQNPLQYLRQTLLKVAVH